MEHVLAKTIISVGVIELISKHFKVTLDEARDLFYNSDVVDLLDDDETGLYGQSPLFAFSIFERHYKNNKSNK